LSAIEVLTVAVIADWLVTVTPAIAKRKCALAITVVTAGITVLNVTVLSVAVPPEKSVVAAQATPVAEVSAQPEAVDPSLETIVKDGTAVKVPLLNVSVGRI
jgi:hypothetical protein